MERKRLVRSEHQKVLAGVCGGIATYFDLDPNLVRLICLVLIVLQPAFALVYLLLVFVLPREGAEEKPLEARIEEGVHELESTVERIAGDEEPSKGRFFAGLALVVVGLFLLLENLGLWWVDGSTLAALVLVGIGAYLLITRSR